MKNSRALRTFIFIFLISLSGGSILAQGDGSDRSLTADDITSAISINTIPETPGANQNVSLYIDGTGVDLDTAIISWSVNGQKVSSGQGQKRFNLTTGPIGSKTTVSVNIENSAVSFTRSIVISPGEIDILWEGKTYVPPFYKGRSLWTNQSEIILVAIPHVPGPSGSEMDPTNLIYKWSKNGKVLGLVSGRGRSSLTFSDSVLSKTQVIKVEALTDQNTVVASQTISLSPQNPLTMIYEDNPLYGILFNREVLGSFSLKSKEISFTSIPLFFNTLSKDSSTLKYSWKVNRESFGEPGSRVTFRTPEKATGNSEVGVKINNLTQLMQGSEKKFIIQFNNEGAF